MGRIVSPGLERAVGLGKVPCLRMCLRMCLKPQVCMYSYCTVCLVPMHRRHDRRRVALHGDWSSRPESWRSGGGGEAVMRDEWMDASARARRASGIVCTSLHLGNTLGILEGTCVDAL